jgi:hypothetical protein
MGVVSTSVTRIWRRVGPSSIRVEGAQAPHSPGRGQPTPRRHAACTGLGRQLVAVAHAARLDRRLHPYVAGEGTLFKDDVPQSYRLDLVSSTTFSNGIAPAKLTFRKPTDKRTHLP